jgi:phage-related protein
MILSMPTAKKPCEFVASSKEDLSALPSEVKEILGFAIFLAQSGEKHLRRSR